MAAVAQLLKKVFMFYYDGFRALSSWGRQAWLVIIIKLFIMFAILRIFFFHDFLKTKFSNDSERSEYVIEQLTRNK